MITSNIYKFDKGVLVKYFDGNIQYYRVWKNGKFSPKYYRVGNATNYLWK